MGDIESLDVFSSDNNPSQSPQLKPRTPFRPFQPYCFHAYLVESTKGDLLHILRFYALSDGRFNYGAGRRTTHFVIYKWVFDDEDAGSIGYNVEVKSIGVDAQNGPANIESNLVIICARSSAGKRAEALGEMGW
ncbi:hypothetical protein L3X38_004512 [Prunus dulcis]|uniref:Uncharacterized protein n=1 Tax=Prunus dulcis TaxID=3755 RepID=A0AAD4ZP81_PRUDU|nr:hypothetical protein L3X38_004512 [Prunus dulcis]